jgi:hypothetical protein
MSELECRSTFISVTTLNLAAGFTQPSICTREVKRPQRESSHSLLLNAEIKNAWSFNLSKPSWCGAWAQGNVLTLKDLK